MKTSERSLLPGPRSRDTGRGPPLSGQGVLHRPQSDDSPNLRHQARTSPLVTPSHQEAQEVTSQDQRLRPRGSDASWEDELSHRLNSRGNSSGNRVPRVGCGWRPAMTRPRCKPAWRPACETHRSLCPPARDPQTRLQGASLLQRQPVCRRKNVRKTHQNVVIKKTRRNDYFL